VNQNTQIDAPRENSLLEGAQMVHDTTQDTLRQTSLINESAEYLVKREDSPAFAASTWISTPRVVLNKSRSKQVVEIALCSAKLIQSVMS
jgi:hypothetical protein